MTDTVMICGVRNEDRRTHIERIDAAQSEEVLV